ncbi:hypothetical protein E2C01_007914 [Portunus trituberculatus]|uniref:Uncharacterized protein n=1 Tax=Portunus trituberculatus TaxID=210409 RepID=A0A5B7CZE7_PORTR|nr:hypothetical protein [Portunus trituberculatus]
MEDRDQDLPRKDYQGDRGQNLDKVFHHHKTLTQKGGHAVTLELTIHRTPFSTTNAVAGGYNIQHKKVGASAVRLVIKQHVLDLLCRGGKACGSLIDELLLPLCLSEGTTGVTAIRRLNTGATECMGAHTTRPALLYMGGQVMEDTRPGAVRQVVVATAVHHHDSWPGREGWAGRGGRVVPPLWSPTQ